MMLGATYTQDGRFDVLDLPQPEAGPGELLLRIRAASICGTDLKIIHKGHRKLLPGQRIVLGHEFVGTIEQVGSDVDNYSVGQRIGIAPNIGCGTCASCIRGQANYCPDYSAFGINYDGAHAPYLKVPAVFVGRGNVIPLPDEITDREASLLEPLSCAVNGICNARIQLGNTVVIYGAGPMGLLLAMLSRVAGASRLVMIDPQEQRLEKALSIGCDVGISPDKESVPQRVNHLTGGLGANVVITACPVASVQSEAVELLAPFGRLCLFGGLPMGSSAVPLDTNAIHYKNLLVTGSTGGSVEDYRRAVHLLCGKRIDILRVVSDVFAIDELELAYKTALDGAEGKVVLVTGLG